MGVGGADRGGNVPEPGCAAEGGENACCGRDPARRTVAAEQAPRAEEPRAGGARKDQPAPQRTRTRGRRLARRPGEDGRHGKFQLVRELYVASAAAAAAAAGSDEGGVLLPLAVPGRNRGASRSHHLPGQGGGLGRGGAPRGAGPRRGRGAAALRRGRGLARGGVAGGGAWRAVCAAARAFKPGLARPECAFVAREPSGPAARPLPAVPALPRPGNRLGSEPRAVRPGMPRYELALILKAMQRPETAAALKRTLETLMDRGAVVRNLENLGERALPFKISAHSQKHTRGGYFLVDFYAPTTTVEGMMEHLSRDIDVIRPNIIKHPLTREVKECKGIVPVPLEEKLYSTKKRK
ncbi:28S ribosomal protein S6, mitochondrial [Hippopotamus amphibius kiboko]|uniref:28S ribosomal protein S6, mitochondrial n=1 Tax=Hippopotamus amphibius kiboko TaxID=575201 RepID=UPI002596C0A1|nr:28S ribosomal protein S6, mitochondrial [Hippopotamus amphibius kiboko]